MTREGHHCVRSETIWSSLTGTRVVSAALRVRARPLIALNLPVGAFVMSGGDAVTDTATDQHWPTVGDIQQCIGDAWSEAQSTEDAERCAVLVSVVDNLLELWARS